jgi:hypothetical protein
MFTVADQIALAKINPGSQNQVEIQATTSA